MKSYLYILGRTPDLALLELKTFIPDVRLIDRHIAQSGSDVPIDSLGGTVKIAEVIGEISSLDAIQISKFIPIKSTFGVSVYEGPKIPRSLLEEVKKLSGAARFIEARDGHELSSVVIEKNHVQEFIISGRIIGKTIAVQPFESWNERDYGRPNSDPRAGMLPPKVARMIVNIAGIGTGKTLLDPFCGMGTVLSEGLLSGWNVLGSDIDKNIVEKARGNLRWLLEHNKLGVTYRLFVSDAVHVSEQPDARHTDAIVTEPFMGAAQKALPGAGDVKNTMKGLEKLYIGCLRDWNRILKPGGVVVMALPKYQIAGRIFFVKKVIDMCENLGYTVKAGPADYGRPGAVVTRVFYKFQKK